MSKEVEQTDCQQGWMRPKVGARSEQTMPEGGREGELKAKQDGVVRPGASRLSLDVGLVGGEIGQLLTSRPRLTPGWGLTDGSHPLDSWRYLDPQSFFHFFLFSFFLLFFSSLSRPDWLSLSVKLLRICKTDFSNSVSLNLSWYVINWEIATHDAPGVQRNSSSPHQLQAS